MNNALKAGCAAIYLLALASLVWPFPAGAGPVLQTLAVALIVVHALEMLFVFKHIKSYPGPLLISVVLSLLFGLLHWLPLAKANRRATNT
jgi:uncharacterized protein YhhL (DUF1145 family)